MDTSNNNNTARNPQAPRALRGQLGTLRTTRVFQGTNLVSLSSGPLYGAYNFQLSSLPNYTEFTNLFDKYRIKWVKVTFMPKFSEVDMSNFATYKAAPLATVIDLDDSSNPTATTDLMQYDSYKVTRGNEVHVRSFKPRLAQAAYTGTFTGYTQAPADVWVDCGSPTVQYYGLKFYLDSTPTAGSQQYDVFVKMWIDFCNTR